VELEYLIDYLGKGFVVVKVEDASLGLLFAE
jgi:hypothetical protein